MSNCRAVAPLLVAMAIAAVSAPAWADDRAIRIGISLPLSGLDAESAVRIKNGALLAFDEINASGTLPGYRFAPAIFDDTPLTAQFDPGQAAIIARKMVTDPDVVAAIGPMSSGAGKSMAPILSRGNLAIITPSSTNPDITDPKQAAQYRPAGKAVYFRMVTTDAHQGPLLANYFADVLRVKSVYVLDDSGSYGIAVADAFQRRAEEKGIKVLGRQRLDPTAADYATVLGRIKALDPDALYYGGVSQTGVKLAKQSYDALPQAKKGGGDGVYSAEMLSAAGFPAANGWYATIASPHATEAAAAAAWVQRYRERYGTPPSDYSLTAYDAALVIVDAAQRLLTDGKSIDRANMRDYIETTNLTTLQGTIAFDANGDLRDRTISLFQIKKDPNHPPDDMVHQYHYIGPAPQS